MLILICLHLLTSLLCLIAIINIDDMTNYIKRQNIYIRSTDTGWFALIMAFTPLVNMLILFCVVVHILLEYFSESFSEIIIGFHKIPKVIEKFLRVKNYLNPRDK